jgi:hypothetical protein
MRPVARSLVSWAIGFLPPERRTWSRAVLAELDEADHPVRWALGALLVVAREGRLALAPPVHHAAERRINGSAFALLFAFVFAVAATRRRVTHT